MDDPTAPFDSVKEFPEAGEEGKKEGGAAEAEEEDEVRRRRRVRVFFREKVGEAVVDEGGRGVEVEGARCGSEGYRREEGKETGDGEKWWGEKR